jgi:hypothetical protein
MNSMATKWWICLPLDTWIFRELLSLNGVHCIHVTSHGQWVSMVSVGKFKGPLTYSQEIAFHPSPRKTLPKCFHVIHVSTVDALASPNAVIPNLGGEAEETPINCKVIKMKIRFIESSPADVAPSRHAQLSLPQWSNRNSNPDIEKQRYT